MSRRLSLRNGANLSGRYGQMRQALTGDRERLLANERQNLQRSTAGQIRRVVRSMSEMHKGFSRADMMEILFKQLKKQYVKRGRKVLGVPNDALVNDAEQVHHLEALMRHKGLNVFNMVEHQGLKARQSWGSRGVCSTLEHQPGSQNHINCWFFHVVD